MLDLTIWWTLMTKKKKIDLCEQLKELLNCGVGEDS